MIKRGAGVICNISSLPSDYGIGDFGKGGRAFVDLLADMEMGWWQILPLCPVGSGNSPYSSDSAFAINSLYADPEDLVERGLLTKAEADAARYPGTPYSVDYAFAAETKEKLLRQAYARAVVSDYPDKVQKYVLENESWLPGYMSYMAAKTANGGKPCYQWTKEGDPAEARYCAFKQYILEQQWLSLKKYANDKGVSLLGDMPIYVSHDSADFYTHKDLFLTGPDGRLTKVAGVPPDYFSADGQLWGNPLYDWDKMAADGYRWWTQRIGRSLRLYDAVRIDHFRGFHRFWAVPAGAATAREGSWEDGPGMALFQAVEKAYPNPAIIAEDLGTVDEGLVAFLKETGYPGMKVLQFGFTSPDSDHVPYKYTPNHIAYTGTHDNDTMLGWLWAIPMEEKLRLLEYCRCADGDWREGGPHSQVIHAIITTLWESAAALAILPVQDMCGFGTDTRMNIPGKAEGNWRYRLTPEAIQCIDRDFFRKINRVYGRTR